MGLAWRSMGQVSFLMVLIFIFGLVYFGTGFSARLKRHRHDPIWWLAFYIMLACLVSLGRTFYEVFLDDEPYRFYLNLWVTVPAGFFLMIVSIQLWRRGLKANRPERNAKGSGGSGAE